MLIVERVLPGLTTWVSPILDQLYIDRFPLAEPGVFVIFGEEEGMFREVLVGWCVVNRFTMNV